jgi:peptide/nickel transport system substrate-binding protein
MDPAARWSDGTPVGASDLKYTFDLAREYHLEHAGVWNDLESVDIETKTTVRFTFKEDHINPLELFDALASMHIVPEHIFKPLESELGFEREKILAHSEPGTDTIVASGPYRIQSVSKQRIVLERRADYWGAQRYSSLPAPRFIVHDLYPDPARANAALEQGHVDLLRQSFSETQSDWQRINPAGTWYASRPFYVPASMLCLLINTNRTPFDQLAFRRAIAWAIDYTSISQEALKGYSNPARPSLILPDGFEKQFFPEEDDLQNGWSFDPHRARQILIDAGFTYGPDQILQTVDGETLGPFYIESPFGRDEWTSTMQAVCANLRAIGINLYQKLPEQQVWARHRDLGDFDLLFYWPRPRPGPSLPYSRFDEMLNSSDLAPVGIKAVKNFGRYRNDRLNKILEQLAQDTDIGSQKKWYAELDNLFREDVPVIPLSYWPWVLEESNQTYWTNWPDAGNPYAPPQAAMMGAGIRTLFHLKASPP